MRGFFTGGCNWIFMLCWGAIFSAGARDAEDVRSVPLQYVSFSAVPELPFAERLLTYRAGSNVAAGGNQETSKIETLPTSAGDSCPAEAECTFMSNCPTLRRTQPSTRCEVILTPMRAGVAGMRLPGGTCCRRSRSSTSQTSPPGTSQYNSRPLPVLATAINAAAFGGEGADFADPDLMPRGRKKSSSGHLVNFVVPPNAAGTEQYGTGGKIPLKLLPPQKDSISFLAGEAPVSFVTANKSVNGEKAPQFGGGVNPAVDTKNARPNGGMNNPALVGNVRQPPQLPPLQPLPPLPLQQMASPPQQNFVQQSPPQQQSFNVQQQQPGPPLPAPQQPLFSSNQPNVPVPQPFSNNYPPNQPNPQGAYQAPIPTQQSFFNPQPIGPSPQLSFSQQPPQQYLGPVQNIQPNEIRNQNPPIQPQFASMNPQQQLFNPQPQNFPLPQMANPAFPLGPSPSQNPMQNFQPSQQQGPPPQILQQFPLQGQFLPPNQIPINRNDSNLPPPQQLQPQLLPSRASVSQQPPPVPPPNFSAFNSFSSPTNGPATTFCGVKDPTLARSGRILGGHPSEFGAWPWMAVILSSKRLRCGATILNEQFLLTAAHCVYKNYQYGYYQDLNVRIGLSSMDEDDFGRYAPQEVRIQRVFVHPFFNATQSSYDIALIQLASPIVFQPHIKPVCLPSSEHLGEMGTVIGWGKRKETDDRANLPMVLQEVNMPVLYPWQCILELRSNKIYEDIGPHLSQRPILGDDRHRQQGLRLRKANVPGIYTNIFYLKDWIESTVSANWNIFSGHFGFRERSDAFYYR
ncbi:putative Serine proteinase stubble [Hypsibius exemplaris]|uniref:Serine proteinase stubble n=1 Tax=Hypsibius exemplaris TaxID=2072580 RepID=A0A1W0WCW2_HYPEX|nr:putative Serine proteinase stubble [Hypsibius exemplaris]